MTMPLVVRKGEGKRVVLGPDPWIVLAGGKQTADRFDFMQGTVSYLQGPPLHVHFDQDDSFLVVSGTLKIQIGDDLLDLREGDFATAPRGVPHTFANVEKEPVRLINFVTPGGFDRCLDEMTLMPPGPPDPKQLEEFGKKHRLAIVGPSIPVKLGLL
jgi:mannose-6-phosphate isomerase-like protein (cupin superfamily)